MKTTSARPRKRVFVAAAAVVAVLLAGCCFGGWKLISPAFSDRERPVAAGKATMSATDYRTVLAEVDTSLKAAVPSLKTADRSPLVRGLRAATDRLRDVTPPVNVDRTHRLLRGSMLLLATALEKPQGSSCPAASAYTDTLRSYAVDAVRERAADLRAADPTFVFGTFLPARPAETNRRLKNGAMVKSGARTGSGTLKVKNVFGSDTAVSLVPAGGKKAAFTVYVRGGSSVTVNGVRSGTYRLFTASGKDWETARKGFTRSCSFSRFDDDFPFGGRTAGWTVTLTQSLTGNASTSRVDPGSYPRD